MKQRITDEMKSSMRGGDKKRLGIIRLIMAAIKQKEVDERIELSDDQIVDIMSKMVKQRRESIFQYEKAERADLAEQEAYEIEVLQEFLPESLSDEKIAQEIAKAVEETGASSIRDMGKVMGILKTRLAGKAEMGAVGAKVKEQLSA